MPLVFHKVMQFPEMTATTSLFWGTHYVKQRKNIPYCLVPTENQAKTAALHGVDLTYGKQAILVKNNSGGFPEDFCSLPRLI